ncbi:hypothetical protein BDB00DRAFT_879720 [Zychaea mexicana]|uniref:uncharacterized protein n=1 Tax=Zychaea mexicana TaxID=64656 RepID=UPI0022FE2562|nr:uncharacterized protein BDB00DRAFT_879720 [Zychaea mexicana]KAI9474802.1 hypothetical protein BDB00DRAFT_879720 [Zychaea mexicana]
MGYDFVTLSQSNHHQVEGVNHAIFSVAAAQHEINGEAVDGVAETDQAPKATDGVEDEYVEHSDNGEEGLTDLSNGGANTVNVQELVAQYVDLQELLESKFSISL